MELFRDLARHSSDLDAFVKCHAAEGEQRITSGAPIRGGSPGAREINMGSADFDAAHGGPTVDSANLHGSDRPIVIRVHFPPEPIDTADRSDRAHDPSTTSGRRPSLKF